MTSEKSRLEKTKEILDKLKKIVDAADDIWLGLRNMIPSLSKQVASFLVGSLGTIVHWWEGFLAAVELKNAYQDKDIEPGPRKARMAAAALAIILTGVGSGLGISLLLDTAGLINASAVTLYPFLMSGFLLSIYGIYLARNRYLFQEAQKEYTEADEAYIKAKLEFKYGAAEVGASTIALFGLMLGTDDYFDGVKGLEPTLTDNSSYLIFAGVILGFIVMVCKHRAEEAVKCSYSAINNKTSRSEFSITAEDSLQENKAEAPDPEDDPEDNTAWLHHEVVKIILESQPELLQKAQIEKNPDESILQYLERNNINLSDVGEKTWPTTSQKPEEGSTPSHQRNETPQF